MAQLTPAERGQTLRDRKRARTRQALIDAAAGDTITFDAALVGPKITLTSGQLVIDKGLRIAGPGAVQLAISGAISVEPAPVSE